MIWLVVLFVVPFYAMLAIGEGKLDRQTESPVAVYLPWHWSSANLSNVWHDLFGSGAFVGAIAWRTIWYVAVASLLSLLIAYPAAYFVARFAGRRKGIFLVLLIAPFWISYMMRMLAWIDLLQTNGYVNKVLSFVGLGSPNWLGGHSYTVITGPGLRLHPVPDPGAVRGPGPDRSVADRGGPRPRPRPDAHVLARDAAAVTPGDPDRAC